MKPWEIPGGTLTTNRCTAQSLTCSPMWWSQEGFPKSRAEMYALHSVQPGQVKKTKHRIKNWDTVEALWVDTLVSGQLYLQPPYQNPVLTLAHKNSVFTHSRKRPASVVDTFSASQGCPLSGASTVPRKTSKVTTTCTMQIARGLGFNTAPFKGPLSFCMLCGRLFLFWKTLHCWTCDLIGPIILPDLNMCLCAFEINDSIAWVTYWSQCSSHCLCRRNIFQILNKCTSARNTCGWKWNSEVQNPTNDCVFHCLYQS